MHISTFFVFFIISVKSTACIIKKGLLFPPDTKERPMISAEESAMRKIRKFKPDRKSIRIRLVTAFIVTSVIPILLINIISYCTKSLARWPE